MATDDVLKEVLTDMEMTTYRVWGSEAPRLARIIDRLAALLAERDDHIAQPRKMVEPQWVKCSERLPENYTPVWFSRGSDVRLGYFQGIAITKFGFRSIEGAVYTIGEVTHWLPYTPPTAPADQEDSTHA